MLLDRRNFIKGSARASLALAAGRGLVFAKRHDDDALLDDLSRRCLRYFWDAGDPRTGICRDLIHANPADNLNKGDENRRSTAVTGFALTALCIGAERKWVSRDDAKDRVRRALRSYTGGVVFAQRGWFYHFNDVRTGKRWKNSEVSTSDSIWLLAGALTCRQYFHEDREIGELATRLYSAFDFPWMTDGDGKILSHGWRPEGFIRFRYDNYCQLAAMYLLGIGSPSHPLPPDAWYAWRRNPNSYRNYDYIGTSLLWTYQYSLAWFDFRRRRETRGTKVDWFENSCMVTRAHREWCCTDLAEQFPDYTPTIWGITSSSSPKGYAVWGGPPQHGKIDGTVVPCAAAGSLMLTPDISIPAVHDMNDRYGARISGRYGLADAFNPESGWVSTNTLGLNVGVTLLSAENLRRRSVWQWFMANPEPQRAMRLAGIARL